MDAFVDIVILSLYYWIIVDTLMDIKFGIKLFGHKHRNTKNHI